VFVRVIGCLYNRNKLGHARCYIMKLSVNDFSSCIICKIWGTNQSYWQLRQSLTRNWISVHLLLHRHHLMSWWRYTIVKAENPNAAWTFTNQKKPSGIGIRGTTVLHMHISSHAQRGTQFVTDKQIETYWTRKLLPLHVTSLANYHTGIGFRWTYCNGLFVIGKLPAQFVIIDDSFPRKAISVPISLNVNIVLISVTELWYMIIRLCMCKGHTGHTKVLDSKLSWLTID